MSRAPKFLAVLALALIPLAACQVDQDLRVRVYLAVLQGANPCHAAIDEIWERDKAWAHATANREGYGGVAAADGQNRTSSAAGCFGMTQRHAALFDNGWETRYDCVSNVEAAWELYQRVGRSPWR